jgi:single-stranded-DNA-specific exonuclease
MPEHKQWTIAPPPDSAASAKIAKELSLSLPTARLLVMRGVKTAQEAKRFLSMQDELFHDPFLLRDMEKATVRIARAIARKEPITVYGDYDVDGVTATTLLYLYLRKNGAVVNY